MTRKGNQSLHSRGNPKGRPNHRSVLFALFSLSLTPLFAITPHRADASSPEITYASVDYSNIDSRTPSIAKVQLLSVGSAASEFHRRLSVKYVA
jgi:hypothetical protein